MTEAIKKRDLEKHLRFHGCVLDRHGSEHDVWLNPANDRTASVPRHREIKTQTARAVCRDLGIPPPASR